MIASASILGLGDRGLLILGISTLVVAGTVALVTFAMLKSRELADLSAPYALQALVFYAFFGVIFSGFTLALVMHAYKLKVSQGSEEFDTLAQLLGALLIAFSVELAAAPRVLSGGGSDRERAALFAGFGLGGAVALFCAVWGNLHDHPGLVVLGIALAGVITLGRSWRPPLRSSWLRDSATPPREAG